MTPFNAEKIDFAISSGLGPYINYCTHDNSSHQDSTAPYPQLISADLTAKMITHSQLHALKEIINIASPVVDEIILMKGIAICQNHYPLPHFRIMGDIDLLVSKKDQNKLEEILLSMGYQQKSNNSAEFYQTHHHSMPFYHTGNNIWVELHTYLFPPISAVIHDDLFNLQNIRKNCVIMNKNTYPEKVRCLCPELQLIHTCAHWAEDFNIYKGAIQMVDMILLIKNNNKGLDWGKINSWVNNTASASYLFLLLSYLDKNNILHIEDHPIKFWQLKNSNMGYLNRSILYLLIDRFLPIKSHSNSFINEDMLRIIWQTLLRPAPSITNIILLPWNILFPPEAADRYKFSFFIHRALNRLKPTK
jgi:hypothetical protein